MALLNTLFMAGTKTVQISSKLRMSIKVQEMFSIKNEKRIILVTKATNESGVRGEEEGEEDLRKEKRIESKRERRGGGEMGDRRTKRRKMEEQEKKEAKQT